MRFSPPQGRTEDETAQAKGYLKNIGPHHGLPLRAKRSPKEPPGFDREWPRSIIRRDTAPRGMRSIDCRDGRIQSKLHVNSAGEEADSMPDLSGFVLGDALNVDLLDEIAWMWAAMLGTILVASRVDAWLHDPRS
jgi:hypothetical protein